MKTSTIATFAAALCVFAASPSQGQFSSGSTGADGPLNIGSNTTLNLPADGIFNFTTITVSNGATLRFNRNALNTPVYLLATGDVVINGAIDVSGEGYDSPTLGKGGPGGFDGGFPRFGSFPSGDGQGPGGGQSDLVGANSRSSTVFATPTSFNSNVYGNTLLSPLIGGSGGGSGS